MPEGTEEYLLRIEQHELRIDAVDLDQAIDQGAHPVVVTDRDGYLQFAHQRALP